VADPLVPNRVKEKFEFMGKREGGSFLFKGLQKPFSAQSERI
jgi:hypothetical protein